MKNTPSNNCGASREQQAGGTAFVYKPDQYKPCKGDQNQQHRRNVNHQTPSLAGVPAFMQVIYDGDEAVAGLSDVILACIVVDEGVGGVAGGRERRC